MEIYKLSFNNYVIESEPIITLFDLNQINSSNSGAGLYYIEDQGFRVIYYSDDSKIVYIDVDYKTKYNIDEEYKYYYNYVISFKRDRIIDGILN